MNARYEEFLDQLKQAIEDDREILPTLPEVAILVRDAVESEDTTTKEIADIISLDPAISARLIKVVNSPLYFCNAPIDDLHTAVTRMGARLVRDLIMNLAVKQMYQPTSAAIDSLFREAWDTSVNIAAICLLIADSIDSSRKEQALLAGLIHNIGTLPILRIVGSDHELFDDLSELSTVIRDLQGNVGAILLESWNFPDDLVAVVKECHNFQIARTASPLVDLVQVALLQGGYVDEDPAQHDLNSIPAFSKLGMDPAVDITQLDENRIMLDQARQTLSV